MGRTDEDIVIFNGDQRLKLLLYDRFLRLLEGFLRKQSPKSEKWNYLLERRNK